MSVAPLATAEWRTWVSGADRVLLLLWCVLSVVVGLVYASTWWRLACARRGCRESVVDGERVLLSRSLGPVAIGVREAVVVLPEWLLAEGDDVRRLVMLHEREHIRARDHTVLALAPLVVVAMPWNVALWWQLRRLRLAVELDCDSRVLARGVGAAQYGSLLIAVAGRSRDGILAPAMASSWSLLERRIVAMTRGSSRHQVARSALCLAASVGCLALACETRMPAGPANVRGADTGPISRIADLIESASVSGARFELDGQAVDAAAILAVRRESVHSVEVENRVESGEALGRASVVRVTTRAWAAGHGGDRSRAMAGANAGSLPGALDLAEDATWMVDGRRVDRATALAIAPESIERVAVMKRRVADGRTEDRSSVIDIQTKAAK